MKSISFKRVKGYNMYKLKPTENVCNRQKGATYMLPGRQKLACTNLQAPSSAFCLYEHLDLSKYKS